MGFRISVWRMLFETPNRPLCQRDIRRQFIKSCNVMTVQQIADKVGVTRKLVIKHMRELDIPRNPKGGNNNPSGLNAYKRSLIQRRINLLRQYHCSTLDEYVRKMQYSGQYKKHILKQLHISYYIYDATKYQPLSYWESLLT